MILSVSRRTDIPNYYSNWFFDRIHEGCVMVRNPVNYHQISQIDISEDIVDCIVFWTKNPSNMLKRLNEIEGYPYYFQFTLTGYGKDIEPGLPDKKEEMIPNFCYLSELIGADRVIWRYDPVLINHRYNIDYHIKAFESIAANLKGYTRRVTISFLDYYARIDKNLQALQVHWPSDQEKIMLLKQMADIASANQMVIDTCAEKLDLTGTGVAHGSCINPSVIELITGCHIEAEKDKNQRPACGCIESIDIGAYHTCHTHCQYCYAGCSALNKTVPIDSPLLGSVLTAQDKITRRQVRSMRDGQMKLFE